MANIEFIDDHDDRDSGTQLLYRVVRELRRQSDSLATPLRKTYRGHHMPSRDEIVLMVELLRSVIFPGYFGNRDVTEESLEFHMGATLDRVALIMADEVQRGLCFACETAPGEGVPAHCMARAKRITTAFLGKLPEIRGRLALDAMAAYEGDPAASSPSEAIFCYPGVLALTSHRIAHELYTLQVPLIPRIISEDAHSRTGIDIHPGARLGKSLFIDHGTGVVIGETCVIGDRVKIYQGVTLGARSFPLDENGLPIKHIKRHPTVEDNVVIYANAAILGGDTVIGRNATIGANVFLMESVPPNSMVSSNHPDLRIKQHPQNGDG